MRGLRDAATARATNPGRPVEDRASAGDEHPVV
jgi:hypothetical protein